MARKAILVALVALPLVALDVAAAEMVVPAMVVDVPRGLPIVAAYHKMVMAQFLKLKPLTFVGDGKLEMAKL